jgi:hypothetical protein
VIIGAVALSLTVGAVSCRGGADRSGEVRKGAQLDPIDALSYE